MRGVIFLMAFTVALSACAGDETKVVLSTNDVVAVAQRVQCHSVTKSGNRCKRKAVPGKLYCGRKMFLQLVVCQSKRNLERLNESLVGSLVIAFR